MSAAGNVACVGGFQDKCCSNQSKQIKAALINDSASVMAARSFVVNFPQREDHHHHYMGPVSQLPCCLPYNKHWQYE